MRVILALAAMLTLFAPGVASAVPACSVPLERIVQTSSYLTEQMEVFEKGPASMTLRHKDDPRIVAAFSVDVPVPSIGLSKSEYMSYYEKETSRYAASVQGQNRAVETSFFPFEPLAWRISESSEIDGMGKALEGRISIRLAENCLVKASYIAPDSPNLHSRWKDMATAIVDLRETARPFVLTTDFQREDTSPTGLLGLTVGFFGPLLVIGLMYHALKHYSRLDEPSRNIRVVIGSMAFMSLGLAIQQRDIFINGLSVLKYTDALLLLATCAAVAVAALFMAQRAAVLALITGAVTGSSLLASSAIGWTLDPISSGAVGFSLLIVAVLGFVSWQFSVTENA
jgi:hypothetical protein|nr:hypothetical protein [Neorhizobium tomejilense]